LVLVTPGLLEADRHGRNELGDPGVDAERLAAV